MIFVDYSKDLGWMRREWNLLERQVNFMVSTRHDVYDFRHYRARCVSRARFDGSGFNSLNA